MHFCFRKVPLPVSTQIYLDEKNVFVHSDDNQAGAVTMTTHDCRQEVG